MSRRLIEVVDYPVNNDGKSPIQAVIFDLGKVLADFDHMQSCSGLAEYSDFSAGQIYDLIFKSGIEENYDKGNISSEKFYRFVKIKIGARDLSFEAFSKIWGQIFSPNPAIWPVLDQVEKRAKLFILSNTNEIHWHYIRKLSLIQQYFSNAEQHVLSFKVGARKPDPKIFQHGISLAGCAPEEIFYIDDIPQFVSAFKSLGATGLNYHCQKNTIDFLVAALKKRGILESN